MSQSGNRGRPSWYSTLPDGQLYITIASMRPGSAEWLIVKQEIDHRAARRRARRSYWLFVVGATAATLALAIVANALL